MLVGTDEGLGLSFGSTCHGAGRAMSRTAAKKVQKGNEVRKALEDKGIIVRCASAGELAEEAPHAYKDVDRVVDVVHNAGLARKVARLVPLGGGEGLTHYLNQPTTVITISASESRLTTMAIAQATRL